MREGYLKLRDVSLDIGPHHLLSGINLDAAKKEIVCVLGSNGVGKTTLMRAISGIHHGVTGAVTFDGQDITNKQSHDIVRAGVSQAPEGRHVFSNMSVQHNLFVGAHQRSAAEQPETMKSVLDLFPLLRERLSQKAGTLSGGEQQMLCIGRAMMARPRLLLLDEPSLGLAPMMVRIIFDLIARIRDAGTTIVIVEQNVRAALRVADYGYVMEHGRIVIEGPAADLASDSRILGAYLGRT